MWTPREVDLQGRLVILARQIKSADEMGDIASSDELRGEEWQIRHELRRIRDGRDNNNVA